MVAQLLAGKDRPSDKKPQVLIEEGIGPVFVDPFLHITSPLPESFEFAGVSVIEEWQTLTMVPAGNVAGNPVQSFTIEYWVRESAKNKDVIAFLQATFKSDFFPLKKIEFLGDDIQQYSSSGNKVFIRAVLISQENQDVLLLAKAQSADTMKIYGNAFDEFINNLKMRQ